MTTTNGDRTMTTKLITREVYDAIRAAAQTRFAARLAASLAANPKANAEYHRTEPEAHREAGIACNQDEAVANAERNAVLDLAGCMFHRDEQNCCGTFWLDVLARVEEAEMQGGGDVPRQWQSNFVAVRIAVDGEE